MTGRCIVHSPCRRVPRPALSLPRAKREAAAPRKPRATKASKAAEAAQAASSMAEAACAASGTPASSPPPLALPTGPYIEISVNNFRYLSGERKFVVPLVKGLVLLQGPSGSGKSSLISAIAWAVSGKTADGSCTWGQKKMTCTLRWSPAHPVPGVARLAPSLQHAAHLPAGLRRRLDEAERRGRRVARRAGRQQGRAAVLPIAEAEGGVAPLPGHDAGREERVPAGADARRRGAHGDGDRAARLVQGPVAEAGRLARLGQHAGGHYWGACCRT